jgi:hypothetical protein
MYHRIYERFSFPIPLLGQNGRTLRHSRAMSGSAGLSPSRNGKREGSTLSGYARNSRKECVGLVAGQAVLTAENKSADDFGNEQLGLAGYATSMVTRGTFQVEYAMEDKRLAAIGPNPSGLCMCGCGRKTKIVTKSDRRHGHVMGQPFRFIHGHSGPAEKGPNRFKLRRRTAVIFLERRDGTVLECLVSRKGHRPVEAGPT